MKLIIVFLVAFSFSNCFGQNLNNKLDETEILFIPYYESSEADRHCDYFEEKYLKNNGYSLKVTNSARSSLLNLDSKNMVKKPEYEGGQYVNVMIKLKQENGDVDVFCGSLFRKNYLF